MGVPCTRHFIRQMYGDKVTPASIEESVDLLRQSFDPCCHADTSNYQPPWGIFLYDATASGVLQAMSLF